MGIAYRIFNHIAYNLMDTQSECVKVARSAAKGVGADGTIAEVGAVGAGAFCGSVLAGLRIMSPLAILQSATKSEAELEERAEKMGPWGGFEN